MVDAGAESDFGWFEGILGGKVDVQEENSSFVRGTGWTKDGAHPLIQVVALRTRAAQKCEYLFTKSCL